MKRYSIINRATGMLARQFKRKVWALKYALMAQLFEKPNHYMIIEEIGNNRREILDIWKEHKEIEK